MLEIRFEQIVYATRGFSLGPISLRLGPGERLGIAGAAGAGKTALLRLAGGRIRSSSGHIFFGEREVTRLAAGRRPLVDSSTHLRISGWWSVEHALVASVRRRSPDRDLRVRELEHLAREWDLRPLFGRRVGTLSSGELVRLRLACLEGFRPAIAVLERLFDGAPAAERPELIDRAARMLRITGTTALIELSAFDEIPFVDRVAVAGDGKIVQTGTPAAVYRAPVSAAAAAATGPFSLISGRVRNGVVETAIGQWGVEAEADREVAVVCRREAFAIARRGEESDFLVTAEEAYETGTGWLVRGTVTGGQRIEFAAPRDVSITRGKLLPLRIDPTATALIDRAATAGTSLIGIPIDVIPPLSESR